MCRMHSRRLPRDLWVPTTVLVGIVVGALADHDAGIWRQRGVGVVIWILLLSLLRGESRRVRAQGGVVMKVATIVEYTPSPLQGGFTYRQHKQTQ